MDRLPHPGLDWLTSLAERLSAERRSALLELIDLASAALRTGTPNHFAAVTLPELEAALAAIVIGEGS